MEQKGEMYGYSNVGNDALRWRMDRVGESMLSMFARSTIEPYDIDKTFDECRVRSQW